MCDDCSIIRGARELARYPRRSPLIYTVYISVYTYSRYLPRTYTYIYIMYTHLYTVQQQQQQQQPARYRAVGACYVRTYIYTIYIYIYAYIIMCIMLYIYTHAETKSTRSLVSGLAMTNGRGLSINYIYIPISIYALTYYNNTYIPAYRYVCALGELCRDRHR